MSKCNIRSYIEGLVSGLTIPPLNNVIPIYYSYGGHVLAKLPEEYYELYAETYPNVYMFYRESTDSYFAIATDGYAVYDEETEKLRVYTNDNVSTAYRKSYYTHPSYTSWNEHIIGTSPSGSILDDDYGTIIWTNVNIYTSDDELYLSTITPTPVYR